MRRRFLPHSLSHIVLVVDITEIGLSTGIYPPEGQEKTVNTLRFQSWKDAERYFLRFGDVQAIQDTFQQLAKQGVAVLTIV